MTRARRFGLAVLSGLLLWLSFPNPWAMDFQAWPGRLALVALVPLLGLLPSTAPAEAFRLGLACGAAFFLPGLAWITNVQPLGPGALPAWVGLALWCALFPALFSALAAAAFRRGWPLPLLWLPALWTLVEALREHLFTGFPWLSLGSSQFANPALLPLAAATGQAGLHFAVLLGNAVACAVLVHPGWLLSWGRALTAALLLSGLILTARWQAAEQARWDQTLAQGSGPHLTVAVVQGGIDQDQVWNRTYRQAVLSTYLGYSAQAADQGARLILWPESTFPGFFNEGAPEADAVKAFARQRQVRLLIGSTLSNNGVYTNSAVLVDPDGNTLSYAKRHLVPFGEFVPFRRWVPLLDLALERLGVAGFEPGSEAGRFPVLGLTASPLICYESVFPDLARMEGDDDLLAILTVDTWYGLSPGPIWHASQALVRAVENGAWVARAAATGVSLLAGPDGRLAGRLPLEKAGFLVATVGPARPTPWRRWGGAFLGLCALAALLPGLAQAALRAQKSPA